MYASIFKANEENVMEKEKFILLMEEESINKLEHLGILLPSDPTWRTENYFRLVELHRTKTYNHRKTEKTIPKKIFQRGYPELGLWALRASERRDLTLPILAVDSEPVINWNDEELIEASRILVSLEGTFVFVEKNPDKMRRIIGLVYDVLRYKNVLREVLEDIEYFNNYPEDAQLEKKIWLLLFDMISRGFAERKDKMSEKNMEEFSKENLDGPNSKLWKSKIQIAANIARMRIRKQARFLSELLPKRIRLPSKTVHNPIVEGWINVYRIPLNEIPNLFKRLGLARHVGKEALPPLTFSEDHLLPHHYYCRPFTRSTFLNSELVRNGDFIIQSRTHCVSASVIIEVMKTKELSGSVVQTDIVALPASGYIAALLWMNKYLLSNLIIFGAGNRKQNYETYFEDLGVLNVCVFSENFSDIDPKDTRLLGVVLVLACPPSSNSGVLDPVDLSMSRGGDINLLKDLTDKAENDFKAEEDILMKQRSTLQRALSIPQVQGVVYETFSEFDSENTDLVMTVIQEMNEWAAQKHYKEIIAERTEVSEQSVTEETLQREVEVPLCDLYELAPLPDICPYERNCLSLKNEGVYIALILRKKITRLDSKFMISMAEERGLFGTGSKDDNQDVEKLVSEEMPSSSTDKRKPRAEINIKRISAPTFCSKLKHIQYSNLTFCERSRVGKRITAARIWWKALLHYLNYKKRHRKMRRRLYFPKRNPLNILRRKIYHLKNINFFLDCNHDR